MRTRARRLIESAIDAGLLDLADAAIRALDALEDDHDLESEENGEALAEPLMLICACCGGRGRFGVETPA